MPAKKKTAKKAAQVTLLEANRQARAADQAERDSADRLAAVAAEAVAKEQVKIAKGK